MSNPILWADHNYEMKARRPARRWDVATGQLVPVEDDRGRPAYERVPMTGRVGVVRQVEDIAGTKPMPLPRSIVFLRDDGNEVHCPIRSAAAAGHGAEGSDNSAMRYLLAKAKHSGWLPVGCCPVDMVIRRERTPLQLEAKELREAAKRGEACKPEAVGFGKPPCRHYQAEQAARLALRLREHERQVARNKSATEKQTEALVSFVEKMAPASVTVVADPNAEFAPVKREPPKGTK